jgi:hypothetical protein
MHNPARHVVLAIGSALLLSGCSAAQETPVSSMSTVPPSVAESTLARPTIAPTGAPSPSAADATAVTRATDIVTSLGGSVDLGDVGVVPALPGVPGEFVSVGSWGVQWDPQGRLIYVSVLPQFATPAPGTAISDATARTRLSDYMSRLGVAPGPPDSIFSDPTTAGWRAQWYRRIGGIAAPSDGYLMSVAGDGAFLAYRYFESETKPAPATTISESKALSQFPRCRNGKGGPNGLVETCTIKLEWHAPAMTPGAPLQLCWRIDYTRRDSDGSSASVLWLDAGTGEQVDAGTTM